MQDKFKKINRGFTLIELMTVMAIIGILASAIMVSLSVQKKRAAASKTLTELSAVMQNIYLCKSDDGTINSPGGGQDICTIPGSANSSAYGQWPDISGVNFSYGTVQGSFATASWAYSATSSDSSITICCNSKYGKCNKLENGTCGVSTILK